MTEGEVVRVISWSVAAIALIWLVSYFVRPALDWCYQDIDTFESLLPTVQKVQSIRTHQWRMRYPQTFIRDKEAIDSAWMSDEEAEAHSELLDSLEELKTRLARRRVDVSKFNIADIDASLVVCL